ncbi:hypothetical protein DV736_g6684, partial [Chaetothyriales sp. CBS 134916]
MSHAAKRRAQARRTGTDEPASQRENPHTTSIGSNTPIQPESAESPPLRTPQPPTEGDEPAPGPSDKGKGPDLGLLNDRQVLQLLEDIRADQQALKTPTATNADVPDEVLPRRRPLRVQTAPQYDGTGGRHKIDEFFRKCIYIFEAHGYVPTSTRDAEFCIRQAAMWLNGTPATSFFNVRKDTKTWDAFVTFVKGTSKDKTTRLYEATRALSYTRQKENESSHDLQNRLEEAEEEVRAAGLTESQLLNWRLIHALRRDVRDELLRGPPESYDSREKTIAAATRIENQLPHRDPQNFRRGQNTGGQQTTVRQVTSSSNPHHTNRGKGKGKPIQVEITARGGPYWAYALIDSGAQDDFISQKLVAELDLMGKPPDVAGKAVDGHTIRIYGRHDLCILATDADEARSALHSSLLATDISEFDLILGMNWLWNVNPDINFREGTWRLRPDDHPPSKRAKSGHTAAANVNTWPRPEAAHQDEGAKSRRDDVNAIRINMVTSDDIHPEEGEQLYVLYYIPAPSEEPEMVNPGTSRLIIARMESHPQETADEELPPQYAEFRDVAQDPSAGGSLPKTK